ncbi:MAG: zinc ribbon domain-containing protein [Clostridia bacterium]|nr:zinc ribbon domain-containing protein [Clostridia bacterium]
MFCNNCGKPIEDNAQSCPFCNATVYNTEPVLDTAITEEEDNKKQSNILIFGILSLFFNNSIWGIIAGAIALYLSKSYKDLKGNLPACARTGSILGIVGLILSIFNVISALFSLVLVFVFYILWFIIMTGNIAIMSI